MPRALTLFSVLVRRIDGVIRRVDLPAISRHLAAAEAEASVLARDELPGEAAIVLLPFDPHDPHLADECNGAGRCEFAFRIQHRGIFSAVSLWAVDQSAAIAAAWKRAGINGRLVDALVRYRCLGRCRSCGAMLFADAKIRDSPHGLKCADCP